MPIGPLNPGALTPNPQSRNGAERTHETTAVPAPATDARRVEQPPTTAGDHVELSFAARSLQPLPGPGAGQRLEPARMREVLTRMASGWYDREDVRDIVVGRLTGDLGAAGKA